MHLRSAPLLSLSLLMLVFLAGCSRPPSSTAVVHLKFEPQDKAETTLRAHLPLDSSVELSPISNTELFRITATDIDAQRATDRVNLILVDIQRSVKAAHPEAAFTVWEQATANP